ncbi:MAG: response regulator [Elusimicrobiota bacterium]|nr:response regulator [Elusimicrobiota bacterium]
MGKKILIVDDDPDNAGMLRCALEPLGHWVKVCSNGREAVQTLRSYKPDLMIMEVMMPGMDGYSLTTQVSEDAELGSLPIIVMSSLEVSRRMFERFPQVIAFLRKPFETNDLLKAVKAEFEKSEGPAAKP